MFFNPLPDDKILGLPKLKAFAGLKLNVTQNIKVVFQRIENIVGKEENAGYQHFLLFPNVFKGFFPPVRQKSSLCGKGFKDALELRGEKSLESKFAAAGSRTCNLQVERQIHYPLSCMVDDEQPQFWFFKINNNNNNNNNNKNDDKNPLIGHIHGESHLVRV